MQHKSCAKLYFNLETRREMFFFLLLHNNIVKNVCMFAGISNLSGVRSSGCGGHGNLSFIYFFSNYFSKDERGSFSAANLSLS